MSIVISCDTISNILLSREVDASHNSGFPGKLFISREPNMNLHSHTFQGVQFFCIFLSSNSGAFCGWSLGFGDVHHFWDISEHSSPSTPISRLGTFGFTSTHTVRKFGKAFDFDDTSCVCQSVFIGLLMWKLFPVLLTLAILYLYHCEVRLKVHCTVHINSQRF